MASEAGKDTPRPCAYPSPASEASWVRDIRVETTTRLEPAGASLMLFHSICVVPRRDMLSFRPNWNIGSR